MRTRRAFVNFDPADPGRLATAPQEPEELTADGFARAYDGFETARGARFHIDDAAQALWKASQRGETEERFETLENVPRGELKQAVIFDDGDMHVFPCPVGADGEPVLGDLPCERILTRAEIYAASGMDDPVPAARFVEGEHRAQVRIGIRDEEEFRETFLDGRSCSLSEAEMDRVIYPFEAGEIGADLGGIALRPAGADEWIVEIEARVNAADLFNVAAARAARAAGHDDDYVPESVADAIFEAFWGGNDSPSPMDMGFEILDWGPVPAPEAGAEEPAP